MRISSLNEGSINIAVSEVVSNTNQGKKTYNRVDLGVSYEK